MAAPFCCFGRDAGAPWPSSKVGVPSEDAGIRSEFSDFYGKMLIFGCYIMCFLDLYCSFMLFVMHAFVCFFDYMDLNWIEYMFCLY